MEYMKKHDRPINMLDGKKQNQLLKKGEVSMLHSKKLLAVATASFLAINLLGCASITSSDRDMLYQLEQCGIDKNEQAIKHPGVAGGLNLLPGVGNFYLAVGTDEGSQWALGFVNLLLWPISITWAIPEAAIDANTINKKETIRYYRFNEDGKKKFENCKASKSDDNKFKN